jgi:hypothetical protein
MNNLPLELELVYRQQCDLIDKCSREQAISLYKDLLHLHLATKAVTREILKQGRAIDGLLRE